MKLDLLLRPENYAAGIYAVCLKTKRILLCKRGPKLENEPNVFANLGGKANIGEKPYETAVREFYEEGGVYVPIKLIPSVVDKKGNFTFYNFIGLVEDEFTPLINKLTVDMEIEITDYKWLSFKQFMDIKKSLIHTGVAHFRKEAEEHLKKLIG